MAGIQADGTLVPNGGPMLTDAALKQLKAKAKPYKATDRDGMYA